MVFSVQEARNLAMKAKLLIQEQTRNTNYIRYRGVDNKALSDKGKEPLVIYNTMETANAGVGKRKGRVVEGGKGNTFVPAINNNPYTIPFYAKCYRCGEFVDHSNECLKWKVVNVVEKDDYVVGDEVRKPDGDDDYE
ncbi:conserved hypothetical protein [Ricinus communis]|uniref:Uncharacterized protein n=1 Tax=Ricinus communis TaxID=3988 RepID=B9REH1_RICCO|nr:conserved hypothetical protein [Ricinus communis]